MIPHQKKARSRKTTSLPISAAFPHKASFCSHSRLILYDAETSIDKNMKMFCA
jgi:hypothetical protein